MARIVHFLLIIFYSLFGMVILSSQGVTPSSPSSLTLDLLFDISSNSSGYAMDQLKLLETHIRNARGDKKTQLSSVLVMSFASDNIMDYAYPGLFVNSIFSFYRNYTFKFLHERNGGDYFPQDRRWNKIAAIVDAIENGWGKKFSIFVTHDADLIFTDFNFDIELFMAQYPKAHIIMSADAFDLANSGFILVRNTKWSYEFFLTWYSARYAHECDQHSLNDLIRRLKTSKGFQKKLLILPKGS